ncbi:unnamed protein product [Closterium sp. NIES-54]
MLPCMQDIFPCVANTAYMHCMPHRLAPAATTPFHRMSSHAISCHVMPCHAMSRHVMPCHAMSCRPMPPSWHFKAATICDYSKEEFPFSLETAVFAFSLCIIPAPLPVQLILSWHFKAATICDYSKEEFPFSLETAVSPCAFP